MKLIIEDKFQTYTTEFKNMDVSMDQIIEAFKGMLLSYGFHINTIDQYLKTDDDNL